MESILIGYGIFCIATAITMAYSVLAPVLKKLSEKQPDNVLVVNGTLTYIVFTLMAVLVAPLLLVPAIQGSNKFKDSLYNAVKD